MSAYSTSKQIWGMWDKYVFKGESWGELLGVTTSSVFTANSAKGIVADLRNYSYVKHDILTSQCFVEGTLVVTEDGDKPIEEIKAGDFVYSTNPETGESEYKEVLRTFRKESDVLIHIFVNDEEIETTPVHPFWVVDEWVSAKDLEAGDILTLADGSPKFAMISTLAGAVINMMLDPLFIFVFRWGMMGAAVATIIGQIITAVLAFWYLLNMKLVKPSKHDLRINAYIVKRTLILGLTSFLSQISLVAAMAAINNMIREYGATDPVFGLEQYAQIPMAVVGIVMKFFQIVISVVVGMAAGCIPIVGFNMGAGLKNRVRELFTKLLIAEACVGAAALLIVELFPQFLIQIFGAANESVYYTDFAVRSFRIYLCMMIFACVNKATFIFLQAMGKAVESTALSIIREIVFGVGFALLLPVFLGLDGVLYSMPVSDILTFTIALFLIVRTYKEIDRADDRNIIVKEMQK